MQEILRGFCIVSSDSDYTGLAKRIREEEVFVMGIGVKSTPVAFVQSCEIFTYCETIAGSTVAPEKTIQSSKATAAKSSPVLPKVDKDVIEKAYDIASNDNESTFIANLGWQLRKLDPSFDARAYGFKNLTLLMSSLSEYEVFHKEINGDQILMVRKRNDTATKITK